MEERHIPMDVAEEILCYLPVKSLVRFRSVSKSWKRKISETRFIRRHLNLQADDRKRLLVDYVPACHQRYFSSMCLSLMASSSSSSSSNEAAAADSSVTDILFPFEDKPYCAFVLAICDELWVVETGASPPSVCLYNPSMRTYRELPDKPRTWINLLSGKRWVGVGYDFVGDDYKVFMAPSPCKWFELDYEGQQFETHLYSLRNDCWRKIDTDNNCSFASLFESTYSAPKRSAQYFNGVLHWVVYPLDLINVDWDYAIICFDLTVDKYVAELPPPPSYPIHHHANVHERTRVIHTTVSVAVLKGMLSVVLSYMDSQPQQLVLWMMKDYGVAESWTKMYEISYDAHHPIFPPRSTDRRPLILYMFNNGHILILTDGSVDYDSYVVVYQDDHTPIRNHVVPPTRRCPSSRKIGYGYIYVESLVLTGDGLY